jgi:hypothetical protein
MQSRQYYHQIIETSPWISRKDRDTLPTKTYVKQERYKKRALFSRAKIEKLMAVAIAQSNVIGWAIVAKRIAYRFYPENRIVKNSRSLG